MLTNFFCNAAVSNNQIVSVAAQTQAVLRKICNAPLSHKHKGNVCKSLSATTCISLSKPAILQDAETDHAQQSQSCTCKPLMKRRYVTNVPTKESPSMWQ